MADTKLHVLPSLMLTLCIFIVCLKECLSARKSEVRTPLISVNLMDCISPIGDVTSKKIGLVRCLPEKRSKEWIFVNSSFQYRQDRRYCIVPYCKKKKVEISRCSNKTGMWKRGKNSTLYNTLCENLSLTQKNEAVILAKRGSSKGQKWLVLNDLKALLKDVPPAKYPENNTGNIFLFEMMKSLVNTYTPLETPLPYSRDVGSFPGKVKSKIDRITGMIFLAKKWEGRSNLLNTNLEWRQPTELYAVPGEKIQVTLSKSKALNGIVLLIGAQNDILTDKSPNTKKMFLRMPVVTEEYILMPGLNKLRSQYGGNIIFRYNGSSKFTAKSIVSNVVGAPYFERGYTTLKEWTTLKLRGAPQTVLVSELCVLVLSTMAAKKIQNPADLLERYDKVITSANSLAGFVRDEDPPSGQHWFINDIQLPEGKIRGGFPIMLDQNYSLADNKTIYKWEVLREIGENYKQFCWSSCLSKTTGDFYALFLQEKLEIRSKVDSVLTNKAHSRLKKGQTFYTVTDEERLVFFMDIKKKAGPTGWYPFQVLHKTLRVNKIDLNLRSRAEQRNLLYSVLSKAALVDLYNTFSFWGLNVTKATRDKLTKTLKKEKRGSSAPRTSFSLFTVVLFLSFGAGINLCL